MNSHDIWPFHRSCFTYNVFWSLCYRIYQNYIHFFIAERNSIIWTQSLDPGGLVSGPTVETKIHRCSSPRVIAFNLWILYPQIQPILKSKHSAKFIENNLYISGVFFKGHLYPTVHYLIHSPLVDKKFISTLSIMMILLWTLRLCVDIYG